MKCAVLVEIEAQCEKREDMMRVSLTVWQLILLGMHFYWLVDSVSIAVGAAIYCSCEIFILAFQLILRHLKVIHTNNLYLTIQKVFCILHFLNFIPLCLVVFSVQYFAIENSLAIRLMQLLGFQSATYYLLLCVWFSVICWNVSKRSKSGIKNATLVTYETARVEKWMKSHYPQQNYVAEEEGDASCSDVSMSSSEENSDCSICLDKFTSKGMVCRLNCKHYYHLDCIYKWLQHQNSRKVCPLCKNVNQLEDV